MLVGGLDFPILAKTDDKIPPNKADIGAVGGPNWLPAHLRRSNWRVPFAIVPSLRPIPSRPTRQGRGPDWCCNGWGKYHCA
jgi:hypothetical protein